MSGCLLVKAQFLWLWLNSPWLRYGDLPYCSLSFWFNWAHFSISCVENYQKMAFSKLKYSNPRTIELNQKRRARPKMCTFGDCQRLLVLMIKIHRKVLKAYSYSKKHSVVLFRGTLVRRSLKAVVSSNIFVIQCWILVACKKHPNGATENSLRKRIQINYRWRCRKTFLWCEHW